MSDPGPHRAHHADPKPAGLRAKASRERIAFWLPIAIFALLVLIAPDILLLVFAGLLVAVFLRMGGNAIARRLHIREGWGLALYSIMLVCLAVLFFLYAAQGLSDQLDQLTTALPKAMKQVQDFIDSHGWLHSITRSIDLGSIAPSSKGAATTVMMSIGVIGNAMLILFIGVYGAVEPQLYRRGIAALFPASKRDWVVASFATGWAALSGWLFAQLISMTVIGLLTFVGLWLLNVPLAAILAILAGLLTFIPNIGPVLSAIPALAMGLTVSPITMLWVVVLYLAVQALESNLITPQIQEKAMSLPPALIIAFQLLMGSFFGLLGLALATPLLAVLMMMTRRHYLPLIRPETA